MATIDEFLASLEADFGETGKGKPFEKFCKWFLENDPEWSKTVDKVWLWEDYPNKWQTQDLGTDLVFRDNEGLIWAVQAKCYAEHATTTKSDVNSFLADMGRQGVDRGLWIQTTNRMANTAQKSLTDRDKPVTVFQLNDFRDAPIDYPSSFDEISKAKVKDRPKPDTHQEEAIVAVKAGLSENDRGQLIMACGTGKTFTTLWIKEALEAETTLLLLPSLSLLSQTMREWAWAGNTDFAILNVCSDKSVGKRSAEDMKISEAPFPVTSEVGEIREFLNKAGPKVLFCTYQSSDLIAQAQADQSVPAFDLAIADEAHRCAGKADAGFATILDGEKIRATKRLFTTATPRYFGKAIKDEAKARTLDVIGMDDESVFGPVVHKLSFGEAIERELLTDYQVVIVGVDEPMVKDWIDNYEIVSTNPDENTDARTLAAKIGLIKAIKDYDLERVISFHSKVARAKEFSEELPEIIDLVEQEHKPDGKFLSHYVSGAMKAGDRKDKIDQLKQLEGYDRGILTNARCLAEGVDVPSLDGVAFIDPRGSQVDIIQAVGRAIRKVRGVSVQKKGTIVIPVFIEDGDDPEASIEASNFKPVWDVLKALKSHDDELDKKLNAYRTNMAKNANQSKEDLSDKIIFDLPHSAGTEFAESLRTVLVEATTASWEYWFGLLELYYKREKHSLVEKDHVEGGKRLGNWVSIQRRDRHKLSKSFIDRLNSLDFVWNVLEARWNKALSLLQNFYDTNGHTAVPDDMRPDGFALRAWIKEQRKSWPKLSAERKARLIEAGFELNPHEDLWNQGFHNYEDYLKKGGDLLVPAQFFHNGLNLGSWLNSQRQKLKNGKLAGEKKRKLFEIGFVPVVADYVWQRNLKLMTAALQENNWSSLPVNYSINNIEIGSWASTQRILFSKGKLREDQIRDLENVGFIFDIDEARWIKGLDKFKAFVAREKHAIVPDKFVEDGFHLGTWLYMQRRNKKNISSERKKYLMNLASFGIHSKLSGRKGMGIW